MEVIESQVFEGPVSAMGSEGPSMRWIVVSPYGKRHAHSLGDPLELHCMPLGILEQAVAQGRLTLVDTLPDHPIIRLQRAKERRGLVDTHLGLHGQLLTRMLEFLDGAAGEGADYAPHLAGEILALSTAAFHSKASMARIRERVHAAIGRLSFDLSD